MTDDGTAEGDCARAWGLSERQLERVERRLRRRHRQLDAAELTQWAAVRAVLRDKGHAVPPVTGGMA